MVLRKVPTKACIEIHKERNDSGYDLLYNGTIVDPETTQLECNGEGELVVKKDGERHVFSVKPVAQPLSIKYVKAYEQFHYEYQPDSAKLKIHPLRKMPKIWYNKGIRIAEKQHQKGEEENAENRDSNKR